MNNPSVSTSGNNKDLCPNGDRNGNAVAGPGVEGYAARTSASPQGNP